MLQNYIVVAIRNLFRHKVYSLINIGGLAFGMSSLLLTSLFVQKEFRQNAFHKKGDQIYQVLRRTDTKDADPIWSKRVTGQLGYALQNSFPEILKVVRVSDGYSMLKIGNQKIGQEIIYADPEILEVFSFPLIVGDPKTALTSPFSMLITEHRAKSIFGSENPMGKSVTLEGEKSPGEYTITGILKEVKDSDLKIEVLVSPPPGSNEFNKWARNEKKLNVGDGGVAETFILLSEGHQALELERKLPTFVGNYFGKEIGAVQSYKLQSLRQMHFGIRGKGNIKQVYEITFIGGLILLIACLNFVNLSTARSINRAPEVGVRKVVGASRRQIIHQFFGENLLISLVSLIIAIGIAEILLPSFNNLVRADLSLFSEVWVLFWIILLTWSVGLAAGIYPALFLSGLQPVRVLKGGIVAGRQRGIFRKGLVVLQFSMAIMLMVCAGITYDQWNFMKNRNMGFDKENIVYIQIFDAYDRFSQKDGPSLWQQYKTVKREFLNHPNILKASAAYNAMFWGNRFERVVPEGFQGNSIGMHRISGDEDFIEFWGLKLIQGRNFNAEIESDYSESFILNETAVRRLGWTDPIGKQFAWNRRNGIVIGVVEDFHTQSVKEPLGPTLLVMTNENLRALWLKIKGDQVQETLSFMKRKWEQFLPEVPFFFRFVDESIAYQYRQEEKFTYIVSGGALLAVFVGCLGLLGLALYVVEQKRKEIAIRKFVGASVSHIIYSLSSDLLKPILLANLIAWPFAYWAMSRFLEVYPYRVAIDPLVFVIGGGVALGLGLLTVSGLTVRSARENLINALRYE